jgi:hypothetical protein
VRKEQSGLEAMRPALRWLPASLLVRPDARGFAGTQHFAAQRAEPNALAKISFVNLRLRRIAPAAKNAPSTETVLVGKRR